VRASPRRTPVYEYRDLEEECKRLEDPENHVRAVGLALPDGERRRRGNCPPGWRL